MPLNGSKANNKSFKSIKRVLVETFEPEEDIQVKDVIASQLLAIDEKLFLSFIKSSDSNVRSLVLRYVDNDPGLVKRAGKGSFLESYYLEEKENIIGQYVVVFDKIDRHYFQESEIKGWNESIKASLVEQDCEKLGKLARLSGLLGNTAGLEIFSYLAKQDDLHPSVLVDILWMVKRLLTGTETGKMEQIREFSQYLSPRQLITLADFAEFGTAGMLLIFELLAVIGDFDQKKDLVYSFFEEIMQSDDYQLQIILLKALASSQSYKADIMLCEALSTNDYDSVRETAAEVLASKKSIACLEVVRNSLVHDPDFAVRGRCVQILAAKGEQDDVWLLIRAVLDSDKYVVRKALAALKGRQLDDRLAVIIEKLLESTDIMDRQAAFSVLQRVNLENKVELLIKALKNEKTNLRTEIIKDLAETKQFNQEIADLLEYYLINDSFFETRSEAAISLGRIGSKASIPLLLERYFTEEDFEAKKGIMIALSTLGSKEVRQKMVHVLKESYEHSNREILLAIEATGMMRLIEALEYLQPFFSSNDYDIRWQAVVSAGEILEEVVDPLLIPENLIDSIVKLVKDDSRSTIRSAACWTLAKMTQAGMERVIQVLVDRLKNDVDNMVREMAAEMLGNYQSPLNEAIPVLIDMLEKERDPSVRYYSAYSLGLIARSISGEIIAYQKTLEKSKHL
ncbi:MAG: HEAT repeat domain-containing protein [Candidatus Odinarchaeota archaeon]